jgi:CheY-like chemotaxis protein/two-component sensor histidine kinase
MRHVAQIRTSGDHLLHLIDEVLDLSKIEVGNIALSLEPVPLEPLLERLHSALSPLAAKADVAIDRTGDPSLIARADGTRLLQVLMNLGNNALKYNRPNGRLTLSTERLDEKMVRIMVVDTGFGIPLGRQAEVFQAFNRLGAESSPVEGTGIGLNITQRLVHLMGGQISFFSTPNVGTAFYVDLPAWNGLVPPVAQAIEAADEPVPVRQGYSLLYIEDNPSNIELMQGLVEALDGIALLTAEHPRHGLALAAEHRPDVIVLDIDLPEMNGYQVLETLKNDPATAAIPVIALTAAAMPSDIERGLAAGFAHYLTKPINVRDFFATLEDVIGEG